MNDVRLPAALLQEMRAHAESAYPEECCGFLIGRDAPGGRELLRSEPTANRVLADRERRFAIPPQELRALERRLDGSPDSLLGFYHSHPDHPARPSSFDRDHAWPWYTYLVLSVDTGSFARLAAFELDDETGEFREVRIEVNADRPSPGSDLRVSESLRGT